ncbi:hypothetical protein [Allorhizobium undicola]|uniref:hypothetical protein n=1 Tax=Allorhizobium undicola TaxID=78527 RepID=UPI000489EA8A|nr:hypothetical protein [Allorhizobium undicola]
MLIAANLFSFDLFGLTRREQAKSKQSAGQSKSFRHGRTALSQGTTQVAHEDCISTKKPKLSGECGLFHFGLFPVL